MEHGVWLHPTIWRKGIKIIFTDYLMDTNSYIVRIKLVYKGPTKCGYKSSTRINPDGYRVTSLTHNKKVYPSITLHRMLWETFLHKIPEGYEINHIDAVKDNNNFYNLEVVTPKGNMEHANRLGLCNNPIQRENHRNRMLGSKNPFFGKQHTKETKDKLRSKMLGKNAGTKHIQAKFNENTLFKVRKLHYIDKISYDKIAVEFNVSKSCIASIIQGKTYNVNKLSKTELKENFCNNFKC